PFHVQDIRTVLDAEGVRTATVFGWSMGVQVALEFAVLFPERVSRLVLINGTHGHALSTAMQPFFRLPWLPKYLHELLEVLQRRPDWQARLSRLLTSELVIEAVGGTMGRLRRRMRLRDVYRQYQHDVFGGSFGAYLRMFQKLDAHSVYHHLREIP